MKPFTWHRRRPHQPLLSHRPPANTQPGWYPKPPPAPRPVWPPITDGHQLAHNLTVASSALRRAATTLTAAGHHDEAQELEAAVETVTSVWWTVR